MLSSKSSMPLTHISGLLPSILESQIALFTTFVEVITFLYKDCEISLLPFVHPRTLPTPPKNFSKRNSESSRVARELDSVGSEPLLQIFPNHCLDQLKTLNLISNCSSCILLAICGRSQV
jgi:hypothetical protein